MSHYGKDWYGEMSKEEFRQFVSTYIHDSRWAVDRWFPQELRDVFYQRLSQLEKDEIFYV